MLHCYAVNQFNSLTMSDPAFGGRAVQFNNLSSYVVGSAVGLVSEEEVGEASKVGFAVGDVFFSTGVAVGFAVSFVGLIVPEGVEVGLAGAGLGV